MLFQVFGKKKFRSANVKRTYVGILLYALRDVMERKFTCGLKLSAENKTVIAACNIEPKFEDYLFAYRQMLNCFLPTARRGFCTNDFVLQQRVRFAAWNGLKFYYRERKRLSSLGHRRFGNFGQNMKRYVGLIYESEGSQGGRDPPAPN